MLLLLLLFLLRLVWLKWTIYKANKTNLIPLSLKFYSLLWPHTHCPFDHRSAVSPRCVCHWFQRKSRWKGRDSLRLIHRDSGTPASYMWQWGHFQGWRLSCRGHYFFLFMWQNVIAEFCCDMCLKIRLNQLWVNWNKMWVLMLDQTHYL